MKRQAAQLAAAVLSSLACGAAATPKVVWAGAVHRHGDRSPYCDPKLPGMCAASTTHWNIEDPKHKGMLSSQVRAAPARCERRPRPTCPRRLLTFPAAAGSDAPHRGPIAGDEPGLEAREGAQDALLQQGDRGEDVRHAVYAHGPVRAGGGGGGVVVLVLVVVLLMLLVLLVLVLVVLVSCWCCWRWR